MTGAYQRGFGVGSAGAPGVAVDGVAGFLRRRDSGTAGSSGGSGGRRCARRPGTSPGGRGPGYGDDPATAASRGVGR